MKCAFALHQWQCAEHVDAIRRRIAEMRRPVPNLDVAPEPVQELLELDDSFARLSRAATPSEIVAILYGEIIAALAAAYSEHVSATTLSWTIPRAGCCVSR